MKKFLFILLFLTFSFWPVSQINSSNAQAISKPIYAKVIYNNVYFYALPEDKDEHRLFVIPTTYFVNILSKEGTDFYYAQYGDLFGYVKIASVTAMNGTPTNPFATHNFRVFSLDGIGLYQKPSMQNEKLDDIPYLSEELIYYGTMQGEEVIPDKSSDWYFAKYSSSNNYGYVYSVFCDKLPKIEENTETFDVISSPLFTEDSSSDTLSPTAMAFIIIVVILPCLIVLYLLVKPSMIKEKLNKERPKLRAKRNKDYYEFDEGDLT